MTWWKMFLIGLALIVLAPLLAGQLGLLRGKPPENPGVRNGKLRPPSKTPNSVSSQAELWPEHPQREQARIAPLAFQGDGAAALARLRQVIEALPGARVVAAEPNYLRAEFETRLMRFTDDAEFWLDREAGVIHLRSASRLGRKDFGTNRARIEALRERFAAR